ncbi:retrovirus-related pol polyprotein from transposon TNT 1-94, partial [Tanacetum coccineum]
TFLEAIETEKEPVTYYEAIKDKRWRSAMDSELEALEQNKTMIEKLSPNKKALGCKWVYKIKYKSDGTIERFKARLVILDNHQVAGVDYSETFAPATKMVTVRVFLAIVAAKQ